MFKFKNIVVLIFLVFAETVWGQDKLREDPIFIRIHAKIISEADSSAIPYANIINNRTHNGTTTNAEGLFSLEMLNIDSLIVSSVGFQKTILKVPKNYMGNSILVFALKPANYNLGEIQVKGDKQKVDLGLETGSPIDIPIELRGDAFNEKPTVFKALKSPASFLQYKLSKKEKEKRNVRKALIEEANWEELSTHYNKDMVMKVTGLNQAYADTFMVWFNSQNVLSHTSSEYQIKTSISQYFPKFKKKYGLK